MFADLPEVTISTSPPPFLPPSTQVDIGTKFLYILVSPTDSARAAGCSETGRAAGTAFSDRLIQALQQYGKVKLDLNQIH